MDQQKPKLDTGTFHDRRRDKRLVVDCEGVIIESDNFTQVTYPVKINDLSKHGMQVISSIPFDKRSWITVSFSLNGYDVKVDCFVVHCTRTVKDKGVVFVLGCQIAALTDKKEKKKVEEILKGKENKGWFKKLISS